MIKHVFLNKNIIASFQVFSLYKKVWA